MAEPSRSDCEPGRCPSLGDAVAIAITPDLSFKRAVALADKALYQANQVRDRFHVEVMDSFYA